MSIIVNTIRKIWLRNDNKRDSTVSPLSSVTKIENIPYLNNDDIYNKLDIFYPNNTTKKLPTIISIHGGGFFYGLKEVYVHYCSYLASLGFTVVSFNYHLAPEVKFPSVLKETIDVMRFMIDNANKYYIDLNNVFCVGDSAGGTTLLELTTMYTNEDYAKMFDFYIPKGITLRAVAFNCALFKFRLTRSMDSYIAKWYFGKKVNKVIEEDITNPLNYINSKFLPSFITTSYYDFLKDEAKPMYNLLQKLQIKSEYRLYGNKLTKYLGHVFHVNMNLKEAKQINQEETNFFLKFAKNN